MLTFYLIRHGTKEAIPFDPPLTELGLKQAEATAKYLENVSFVHIVASPKTRTRQTADIIAKPHSMHVYTDERLIERMEWEKNKTLNEFMAEWIKTDSDRDYVPIKGSSSNAKGKLMKEVLNELSGKFPEGNVLIVTHGGAIGDLLRNIFTEKSISHVSWPDSDAKHIKILECSVTLINKNDDGYRLLKLNDISHLPVPLI